jgi:hypothetical protein
MPVLLLNASLQPLNVISRRRLVVLVTKERVAFFDDAVERMVVEELAAWRWGHRGPPAAQHRGAAADAASQSPQPAAAG